MAGLSVILSLESQKGVSNKIINKASMLKNDTRLFIKSYTHSSLSRANSPTYSYRSVQFPIAATASFLDVCCLCSQELLPGKDIYMYRGDRGFCSIECRGKQIMMDEQENNARAMKNKSDSCSLAAKKNTRVALNTSNKVSPAPPDREAASLPSPNKPCFYYRGEADTKAALWPCLLHGFLTH